MPRTTPVEGDVTDTIHFCFRAAAARCGFSPHTTDLELLFGLDVLDGRVKYLGAVLISHQVLLQVVLSGPYEHHPVTAVLVGKVQPRVVRLLSIRASVQRAQLSDKRVTSTSETLRPAPFQVFIITGTYFQMDVVILQVTRRDQRSLHGTELCALWDTSL